MKKHKSITSHAPFQATFEHNLPQLHAQTLTGAHFTSPVIVAMLGIAAVLAIAAYVVLKRLFGEDFMRN